MTTPPQDELTPADLELIYIRAQEPDGRWRSVSVAAASDTQFDAWARSRVSIEGDDPTWPPAERLHFCSYLWRYGGLVKLAAPLPDDDADGQQAR